MLLQGNRACHAAINFDLGISCLRISILFRSHAFVVFSARQHTKRAICCRPSGRPSARQTGGSINKKPSCR